MVRIGGPAALVVAGSLLLVAGAPQAPPFHFVDVHESAGIDVRTWAGRPDKPHLLESGGNGVALLDYDADADLDLYVVNGWRLEGTEVIERGRNRLYRNRGDGTFEDVTDAAGVGDDGWGAGVAVGDVDGDSDLDLWVANFGPDVLYLNAGDGTFTRAESPPSIDGWSALGVFFDADQDGDQDLFIAAYIEATMQQVLDAEASLKWRGTEVMMGPFGLEGLANRYFRNDGSGHFEDATEEAGFVDVGLFYSFGLAAVDLDADGLIDLYVANDSNPNYVYHNEGGGRFAEVGLWSGAGLDAAGVAQAGMGVAVGDIESDGLPELLVTHFAQDQSTFYRNLGDMAFVDATLDLGLAEPTFLPLSWGTTLSDFDLDGDLDLFIANGHIYPQADTTPDSGTTFRQTNQLFAWEGEGFVDVSHDSGTGLQVLESSRGTAVGDLDNDGDLDLVISNIDAPPTVLRNDTERRGRWLLVDAPGALEVHVTAAGRTLRRQWLGGGSYASYSDPRFHFGLGAVETIDRVLVRWPDGSETLLEAVEPDQILSVH